MFRTKVAVRPEYTPIYYVRNRIKTDNTARLFFKVTFLYLTCCVLKVLLPFVCQRLSTYVTYGLATELNIYRSFTPIMLTDT